MTVDDERVAWILLDALALGDGPASRKWSISRRTVERYRARMRIDPQLARIVDEKKASTEVELGAIRVRFLRRAVATLEERIQETGANRASVYEIAGAIKIVGELHQVAMAMEDHERPDEPDQAAAEDACGVEGETPTH